jgi:murein DD-endopeptidase MepM/ murein hydrolase activator NlpD
MTGMAGICVLVKHGDKYTGYAHLSRTVINNGQQVSKGQLIGYSGATGAASGPHLHFEVLPLNPNFGNGYAGRVDPVPFLG